MIEILEFLAAPFAACVVLVVILGYFGIHVLSRGIIFVDLALAQIAAMGTVIGFSFGHEPGSVGSLGHALSTTTIGAGVLSLTRTKDPKVPQEAIIGLTYVVASAATIILADLAPEGAEHIKELLAGAILWVTWPTVGKTLFVSAVAGIFHWFLRRQFILISEDPEAAREQGMRLRNWDFLFYLSFGVVIVLAVEIAGVLMVFAYLVAPAMVALASSDRWSVRLVIAWGVGILASILGLAASYRWDFPSGPAIVCALGALLLLSAIWRYLRSRVASAAAPSS